MTVYVMQESGSEIMYNNGDACSDYRSLTSDKTKECYDPYLCSLWSSVV